MKVAAAIAAAVIAAALAVVWFGAGQIAQAELHRERGRRHP